MTQIILDETNFVSVLCSEFNGDFNTVIEESEDYYTALNLFHVHSLRGDNFVVYFPISLYIKFFELCKEVNDFRLLPRLHSNCYKTAKSMFDIIRCYYDDLYILNLRELAFYSNDITFNRANVIIVPLIDEEFRTTYSDDLDLRIVDAGFDNRRKKSQLRYLYGYMTKVWNVIEADDWSKASRSTTADLNLIIAKKIDCSRDKYGGMLVYPYETFKDIMDISSSYEMQVLLMIGLRTVSSKLGSDSRFIINIEKGGITHYG